MRRLLLLAVLLPAAAGCSRKAELNYKRCLKLRVGMTREQMTAVMGEPEETIPFVEGKSLDYLKGRTAYEWSNPASMPGPDHVSVSDATGKIESIRCSNVDIEASVFVEPPAPSTAPAAGAPAVAASTAPAAPALGLPDAAAALRAKDLAKARAIALPLATGGNADAQRLMGLTYFAAEAAGGRPELSAALHWFYQAKAQNDCEASALYATALEGRATPETVASETALAASLGCPSAKAMRAKMLIEGYHDAVAVDAAAGEKLLLEAASEGSPVAQALLGRLRARVAPKDLVEAYRWTLTASRHPVASVFDDPRAGLSNAWSETERAQTRDELQQLEKTMTRAQVAEAARRATPAK